MRPGQMSDDERIAAKYMQDFCAREDVEPDTVWGIVFWLGDWRRRIFGIRF